MSQIDPPLQRPGLRILGGSIFIGMVIWQLATRTVFSGKYEPVRTLRDGWLIIVVEAVIGILGIAWGVLDLRCDTPPDS